MDRPWTVPRAAGIAALSVALLDPAGGAAAAQSAAAAPPAPPPAAIDADDLRRWVGVLAHDSMRGRDTPSPELNRATRWVADRFREFGLRPGLGEDGYRQGFPVTRVRPGEADDQGLVLSGPAGTHRLEPGRDYVVAPTGSAATADASLSAWHAGRGSAPRDDGILLVPVSPDDIVARLSRVREALRSSDAQGAVLALDAPDAYFERVRSFFSAEQVSLGEPDALGKPVVLVRRSSLPAELADALDGSGSPGRGWAARLSTRAEVEGARAWNTIGWVRGSDPELRGEYVVFSAHVDHLGVGEPVEGDSIYNGADDDASGVAALLELAHAFAAADTPPRRSLVFVAFSGEEKGLLGSRWYAEHPVFGLSRTVAAINMDMIGRRWKDSVAAVGKEFSTLGATADEVAVRHPELGLTVVGDLWPDQNLFRRSDHFQFARRGVPALFFFSGLHADYHRPGDEMDELDYEKTARIVRFIHLTGRAVADADRAPEWDPDAYDQVVGDGPDR